jgi:hypothetical protein
MIEAACGRSINPVVRERPANLALPGTRGRLFASDGAGHENVCGRTPAEKPQEEWDG